jgi:hypothetical protein
VLPAALDEIERLNGVCATNEMLNAAAAGIISQLGERNRAAEELARYARHVVGDCVYDVPNESEIVSCPCGYSQTLQAWEAAKRKRAKREAKDKGDDDRGE